MPLQLVTRAQLSLTQQASHECNSHTALRHSHIHASTFPHTHLARPTAARRTVLCVAADLLTSSVVAHTLVQLQARLPVGSQREARLAEARHELPSVHGADLWRGKGWERVKYVGSSYMY